MSATPPELVRALADPQACVLQVRAQPGARRAGALSLWNGRLKVALASPPEDGRANRELLELLAQRLGLRARELELVGGERERNKLVRIAASCAIIRARLESLLGDTR